MLLESIGLLTLGLALLAGGGEALVKGASRLAAALGLTPLFIGLTLVAYGTSSPELVVSGFATLQGLPGVALGNVIGSNIFNSGIVLGVATLISPFACQARLIRHEVALIILATVLVIVLSVNGRLTRPEATVLLVTLIGYTVWAYRRSTVASTSEGPAMPVESAVTSGRLANVLLVLAGLAMLVVGARWVVRGAISLAGLLDVSDTLIGLTVVAAGTSLPELATSTVAALRGHTDIAIGNVLGSNLFNLLGVLGLSGMLNPLPVPSHILRFDLPIALVFAAACVPLGLTGGRVSRIEGAALLTGYIAYMVLLVYLRV